MLLGMGKVLREAPGEIWCPVLSMTAPVLEGRGGEPYLGDVAGLLSPHLPQHRAQVRDHVCNQVCVWAGGDWVQLGPWNNSGEILRRVSGKQDWDSLGGKNLGQRIRKEGAVRNCLSNGHYLPRRLYIYTVLILTQGYVYWFERETHTHRFEKYQFVASPGCPDLGWNLLHFGARDDVPTNWATWPELHTYVF